MPSNKYMAEYMRNYRAKHKEFYEMEYKTDPEYRQKNI